MELFEMQRLLLQMVLFLLYTNLVVQTTFDNKMPPTILVRQQMTIDTGSKQKTAVSLPAMDIKLLLSLQKPSLYQSHKNIYVAE